MSILLFQDNASTTIASGITAVDTTITVAASTGSYFSTPGAGQYALGTLEDVNGNVEVVKITGRSGDSFTVVRGYETIPGQAGGPALAFASGSRFEQRVTAGMLALFLQKQGGDTLSGTTTVSGVIDLGSGGSIHNGEIAGTAIRSQPGDTSNQILVPIGSPATAAGSVILTAANLVANLPSGVGVNVTGMITMWYGSVGAIPTGYVLCDGRPGTPDLRDKFVLGGGGALPSAGGSATTVTGSAGAYSPGTTGSYTLTLADIPAHHHRFWGASATSNVASGSGHGWDFGVALAYQTQVPSGASSVPSPNQFIEDTGGGGGHSHTIPGAAAHTHSYNLPPYQAIFYIIKT